MKFKLLLSLAFLVGCSVDKDGDGVLDDVDCNDDDASVSEIKLEVCDGVDNDCDGEIDEGVLGTFYRDADGDGYGIDGDSDDSVVIACSAPVGYVSNADDCEDSNSLINPEGSEICDTLDNDCDGLIDDDDSNLDSDSQTTFYRDADGDQFADPNTSIDSCNQPEGYILVENNVFDCDDENDDIHPYDGTESTSAEGVVVIDGEIVGDSDNVDENCDGLIACYFDGDRDGYGSGDPAFTQAPLEGEDKPCVDANAESTDHTFSNNSLDCADDDPAAFPGSAENESDLSLREMCLLDSDGDGYGDASPTNSNIVAGSDCDDGHSGVFPDQVETVADGTDQNCDALELCYQDLDGDGYGSQLTVLVEEYDCSSTGVSVSNTDCDDNDLVTFPGAAEHDSTSLCMTDADGDGFGDVAARGSVTPGTDCDDAGSDINTAADELCDSIDNNCDGAVDESTSLDALVWYPDGDADGYPSQSGAINSCEQPSGYLDGTQDVDCDDADASIHPNAQEGVADSVDQNCDTYEACYADADSDGFGSTVVIFSSDTDCSDQHEADDSDDCDDTAATTKPGAAQLDSTTDCMSDADGDGYGASNIVNLAVVSGTDCNDSDANIQPGAVEQPVDGIDQNCDGIELCYLDADVDNYGNIAGDVIASDNLLCDDQDFESNVNTDCNDLDASQYPGAAEQCNAEDDDCDGETDEGINQTAPLDAPTWYGDADLDGYGNAQFSMLQCVQPVGFVSDNTDCNDLSADVHPGIAFESCFDGIDNDCDGVIDGADDCVASAGDADVSIYGPTGGANAGMAISSGDVNGDGYQDLLIAAPGDGDGGVYLTYGPFNADQNLSSDFDAVFWGSTSDTLGESGVGLSTALLDLNNDGQDDIVVSSPGSDGLGVVYVVYAPSGTDFSGTYTLSDSSGLVAADAAFYGETVSVEDDEGNPVAANIQLGCDIAEMGDVNGDDFEDILVGSCVDEALPGYALLIYGQASKATGHYLFNSGFEADHSDLTNSGLNREDGASLDLNAALFYGSANGTAFGRSVGNAGDINGDLLNDLLFGAPLYGTTDVGAAYLLYGDPSMYSGTLIASQNMNSVTYGDAGDQMGDELGAAGDIDGDGYGDFYTSSTTYGTDQGYVRFYLGSAAALESTVDPVATIYGQSNYDHFGSDLIVLGDVNQDGMDDVLIGAEGATSLGSAYVFYGGSMSVDIDMSAGDSASELLTGDDSLIGQNSNFGSVFCLEDFNGDGSLDIAAGVGLQDASSNSDAGAVFIFSSLFD